MAVEYTETLARLGIGSAHPGGFAATVEQLKRFPIPKGTRVLEVGCGTGRTACYLARLGAVVTAVDIHPKMIAKARRRAAAERVRVEFLEADAEKLPFADRHFGVVLVESVSIFTDTPRALSEYRRVLIPGGRLYDREIIAARPLPQDVAAIVREFFGVERLWTQEQWQHLLRNAGFAEPTIWRPASFPRNPQPAGFFGMDRAQMIDFGGAIDPRSVTTMARYHEIMTTYGDNFAYALLIGTRPQSR